MLDVALDAGPAWPGDVDWLDLAEAAVRAALVQTPAASLISAAACIELSVKLADDAEVQGLNAAYRNKDKPTNVLAFPMLPTDLLETVTTNTDDGEVLLGDIILAYETCAREAEERGISLADHVTHLVAHGTLHLVGYDHEDDVSAIDMEAIETRALESLGLADPYGDREPGHAGAPDETGN